MLQFLMTAQLVRRRRAALDGEYRDKRPIRQLQRWAGSRRT